MTQPETGWIGSWSPGIGDPDFAGWFTVVAYLIAAFMCWRAYRRIPPSSPAKGWKGVLVTLAPLPLAMLASGARIRSTSPNVRLRSLWLGFFLMLLFLGINKQLDLQTAVTEMGRMAAHSEGWYAIRRRFQVVFILLVFLASAWLFRSILLLASGYRRRLSPVLLGIAFLVCFVTTRAASFHHIDRLLGVNFAGFKLNWILELGGIGLVIFGARNVLHASSTRKAGPPARPSR